ncbi:hypothetical protein [Chelatococcus asaccharovorans]|uniref:hypothetical protein n=1 Tax=Chelatococcus asaccharovorans TaxID=28210 RepID=UPI0022649494|nr:hypothetical protein [Chelatococcus asaccharovorans]
MAYAETDHAECVELLEPRDACAVLTYSGIAADRHERHDARGVFAGATPTMGSRDDYLAGIPRIRERHGIHNRDGPPMRCIDLKALCHFQERIALLFQVPLPDIVKFV